MKSKKRQPAKLIRISSIYQGEMMDIGDNSFFLLNGENYQRIRIFGIVVDRFDFRESNPPYSIITIDDSSESIQLRVWKRIITRDNGDKYDTFKMIDGIKIGDIIDVIGKVRNYNDQFYISPQSITKNLDIDWEIHRRATFINLDVENNGLTVEKSPFEKIENEDNSYKNNLNLRVLNSLKSDMNENSIDLLEKRLSLKRDKLQEILRELQLEGLIICPKEGHYIKI